MGEPLISEDRIVELADYPAKWLHNGAPTDEAKSVLQDAIRQAVRETAEACAKVCETTYTEWNGNATGQGKIFAAEIRRRAGKGG